MPFTVPSLSPRTLCFLPLLLLGACASQETHDGGLPDAANEIASEAEGTSNYLFQAATSIQDDWFHMRMRGQTDYQLTIFDEAVAIRARGQESASGLIRAVDIDPVACPEIEWAWAATKIQQSVNLHDKQSDDVAASLFLLFGDPGLYSDPDPVPTLRYVWTTDHVQPDEVIDNPYLSGVVKSIAVRVTSPAGDQASPPAAWVVEHRNILEDFTRAFGHPPAEGLQAFALFSDNDQTSEPVEAYYGWARVNCSGEAASADGASDW
ncbi:DUF3047 domain-containing protein [Pelagibius sp. Alg239-R121]|uniref:DUF3047 domain-containing protein n=1 Tax=Pelagibius sp. Alg239-R121 TaxID=2993448 RepID=UPI0024A68B10|nr:DUF3047 domain-containing protein [Pelagibius sp. Alg239-R121]